MIQDTLYTIILVFYGWIIFLGFITFLLGDSLLILFMYGVLVLYESGIYYLRYYTLPSQGGERERERERKRYQFYTGLIILLVSIDLVFHLFCWFFFPLVENLGERTVLPLMLLSDASRLYYEFYLPNNNGENTTTENFSVLIGT